MESCKGEVASSARYPSDFIEWNVDMRVTVSKEKKSKLYQRSRNILLFLIAVGLAVLLLNIKKEIRALQIQLQYTNVNFLVLVSKYDRLNRSLIRARYRKFGNVYENKKSVESSWLNEEVTNSITELLNDTRIRVNESSYAYTSVIPLLSSIGTLRDKLLFSNGTDNTYKERDPTIEKALIGGNVESTDRVGNNHLRFERAILDFETDNSSENESREDRENDDGDEESSELDYPTEFRTGRSRRDEGRGKKRAQNRRRPKRSRRRLGPFVATFVGAIPEQRLTNSVFIGPWVKSIKNDSQYSFNKFHLVEEKKSIEVTTSGLYMISAQIFYFGEETNYSYWILLTSEGKSNTQKLVKCSTASSVSATEVSCFTSIITSLRRGDRIHLQQQEKDRLIHMREGYSFVQLVLLSNGSRKRRGI